MAGTLDILAACIQYYLKTVKGPGNLLRFVASGIFGTRALKDGTTMAALGLLFHYLIALLFTLFFFFLYPRFSPARKNTLLTILIFGALVWTIMNRLVLPLSAAPPLPFSLEKAAIAMGILILCISTPVVLIARKHYLYKK